MNPAKKPRYSLQHGPTKSQASKTNYVHIISTISWFDFLAVLIACSYFRWKLQIAVTAGSLSKAWEVDIII
jgi:hypothetical protein